MKFRSTCIILILFHIICGIRSSYYEEYYEDDSITYEEYDDYNPESLPQFKTLNLSNEHRPILNREIFEQYENLSEIILNNNKIKLIEVHTFDKFNNTLKKLEITSNNLPSFYIQPIQSLTILNLSNNSLTILNSTKFQNLNLRELDVSSNNLRVVHCLNVAISIYLNHNNISRICQFSKTIIFIDLSYNRIENIQNNTFKNLSSLKRLYLNHNQIVTLQYDTFDSSLLNLIYLNFSHNMFTQFDLIHFKNLKNLESLDLSYNVISTIHQYSKRSLKIYYPDHEYIKTRSFLKFHTLDLEGNPIKNINITNLMEICDHLRTISISFSEISCSMLLKYTSLYHFIKGPIRNEENVKGIKCDSSLDTFTELDAVDSMLLLLKKIKNTLIVLAFFLVVFVIASIIITVRRFRAKIPFNHGTR